MNKIKITKGVLSRDELALSPSYVLTIAGKNRMFIRGKIIFTMDKTTETDKEKFVKKHGLINEKNAWFSQGENSHKHLIFKNEFYERSDVIDLLFRFNKLCIAKVKYFRKNIHKYEPCRYHYKNGFITVPLWDADFLRHKASGYILDFKYLQTITVYEDFVSLYKELEEYE